MTFYATSTTGREFAVESTDDIKPGDIVGPEGQREYVLARRRNSLRTQPGGDDW